MASALERSASFAQSRSSGHHLSRTTVITARAGRRAREKAEAATAAGKGTRGGARASHPSPYDIIGSYGPTPRHTHRTRRLAAASTVHTTPPPPPPTLSRAPRRATASPISPSPARFAAFYQSSSGPPGPWRRALGTWCRALPPLSPLFIRPTSPGASLAQLGRLLLQTSPRLLATAPGERRQRQNPRWVVLCVLVIALAALPCLTLLLPLVSRLVLHLPCLFRDGARLLFSTLCSFPT
ncbi:hypothetical protein PVAP13_7NG427550 [Panicum virgatum]|uniref:Uncharacterized protein n=1 Tax=Panicum virgatum TaxID=38727 RepID=A0A8T0QAA3_PANVG|nr:hypothetical protein PVAP13_7NG427550 [Panicum virgatum]